MDWSPASVIGWSFGSQAGPKDRFLSRWIFLRALGLIYFSAFFPLVFQIRGLIGPHGILPASDYLVSVAHSVGNAKFLYAPTLAWFSASSPMLLAFCWIGMLAAVLLVFNIWPRGMLVVCFLCFLSFVAAAGEFSGYQSDGMLLEAGFLSLFFAPRGFRPGLGLTSPPSRASRFLLLWECFRIYFESGIAKLASGDIQWRNFTALDEYYQNGPLPTWVGWYVQHFPHWFHAVTAFGILTVELVLIWMIFLPRRFRIVSFFLLSFWQIGIILTANYTFLNYLVFALAIPLLDDRFLARFVPLKWRPPTDQSKESSSSSKSDWSAALRKQWNAVQLAVTAVVLTWQAYASTAALVWMLLPSALLPTTPVALLEPFRIADRYGLFAQMTRGRYEIEFQGSMDGSSWTAYPFRFKPQDVDKAPGIYAPYQPRFDWNLWFASLTNWRSDPITIRTEEALLNNEPDVLALFKKNPFPGSAPKYVRAVLWQYWFTTMQEKRTQGVWWRRQLLGLYAPAIERNADGKFVIYQLPTSFPPPPE